jgi:phage terminase small subunit
MGVPKKLTEQQMKFAYELVTNEGRETATQCAVNAGFAKDSAAVNAEVARGKAAGLYIEQKIIRTGKLEDLTTEELELRMKKIIDDYSPILENVPFEELKEQVQEKEKKKESD